MWRSYQLISLVLWQEWTCLMGQNPRASWHCPWPCPRACTQQWERMHHPCLWWHRPSNTCVQQRKANKKEAKIVFGEFTGKGTGELFRVAGMLYMLFGMMATQRVDIQHFILYNLHINKNEVLRHPGIWKLSIYKSTSKFFKLFNN